MIFNSHIGKTGGFTAKQIGESGVRNLLPFPYYEKAGTENGIEWIINDDGTVHVKGTATASVSFTFRATSENWILPNGNYTLSGCPDGGSFSTYRLQIARFVDGTLTSYANEYGAGAAVNITDGLPLLVQFVVAAGVEIDATIKPMLEVGNVKHDYIPYYFGGAEKAKIAENAVNATHAVSADSAATAENAKTAENATNATHAATADDATNLGGYNASDFFKVSGGGTIEFTAYNALKIKRNVTTDTAIVGFTYANDNGVIGMVGFKNGKLYKTGANANASDSYEVLDTSNSTKTVISNTAPSDTTALWIDTSA